MLLFFCCPYRSKYIVLCHIASPPSFVSFVVALFMSLHILKVNFSLLLTFIIILKKNLFTYCLHVSVLSFVFCVETSLLIHFQGAAMLQQRSILFARLNFRTRLFYLALIFAVLVCASLCFFFNFSTFRSTPNFRHNAQLFWFFAEF